VSAVTSIAPSTRTCRCRAAHARAQHTPTQPDRLATLHPTGASCSRIPPCLSHPSDLVPSASCCRARPHHSTHHNTKHQASCPSACNPDKPQTAHRPAAPLAYSRRRRDSHAPVQRAEVISNEPRPPEAPRCPWRRRGGGAACRRCPKASPPVHHKRSLPAPPQLPRVTRPPSATKLSRNLEVDDAELVTQVVRDEEKVEREEEGAEAFAQVESGEEAREVDGDEGDEEDNGENEQILGVHR